MIPQSNMREKIIITVQKFLNTPFKYFELVKMLDNQRNLLLSPNIADKIDDDEYNALWDALMDLEEKMRFAESPKLTVWTNISFLFIFDKNHKIRKQMKS